MTVGILLASFLVLLLIGAPVAVSLGGSAILTSFILAPIPPEVVGQKILANVNHLTLMAVPFFFFAAALMESGGLVRRLVDLVNALVGHWRGGLGITSVASCMLFAAISGSSPATVAAIGRVMYPSLLEKGYTPRYAIGALATSGSLGILIPPSIALILYGFVTETSVSRLFVAGIVPALLYGVGLMVMARFLAGRARVRLQPRESWTARGKAFRAAWPALLVPALIFIGIYGLPQFTIGGLHYEGGGVFTPTEAAIIATILALVVGMLVYREMTPVSAVRTLLATAPTVGMIFFITTNALLFGFFITQLGIPDAVGQWLVDLHTPRWLFLLCINVVLILVGFFLEGVPTILMFVPILFPAAKALGIDPLHFCIVVLVNIELGLIHPPVGLNLFVGSALSGLPVMEVFRAVLPWMCVTFATLLIVTYIPAVSLTLPNLLFR